MSRVNIFKAYRQIAVAGILAFSLLMPLITPRTVAAADLGQATVRFDRMQMNAFTTGTVCAKPTSTATEVDVQVTFPTGYTINTDNSTFTINTTNTAWPATAQPWDGMGTATAVSGQVVTFPSGDLTANTLYCFNWTNSTSAVRVKASASPSNTGTITTRATGSAPIDTAGYSTASVTNDQIAVTATVPSTFSFALNANTDALGVLTTGSVTTSSPARTATVSTNAKNGWMVWARDANTGLLSNTASKTIASTTPGTNSTLVAGTEGYNTGITTSQTGGSGTITVAAPFVGTAAGQGGGLDTSLRALASSNGTADNAVLTIKNNVAINATTPGASDYADTITVVGAGLF